jgi:FkbM family methyltransferase
VLREVTGRKPDIDDCAGAWEASQGVSPSMSIIERVAKPEYWYQPGQMLRRILRRGPLPEVAEVMSPWGLPMRVRPTETVGHAMSHLGVLDLAACEVAWRLLEPGETAIDVGANIGVFSGLLARRTGVSGEVLSLEPHPRIHAELARHVGEWARLGIPMAKIRLISVAASDKAGVADLFEPESFDNNAGSASLEPTGSGSSHRVQTDRLDQILPKGKKFGVVKIDTEGHEPAVLKGAGAMLTDGTFRDIVFEEHGTPPTETTRILLDAGYTLFFIGRSFRGPKLTPPEERSSLPQWLPPNYLATRDPARALSRCLAAGWNVLRG